MTLTYRGVPYSEERYNSLPRIPETTDKEIIYRGNSPQARINPKFPWLRYIKQLFNQSESKPIFDPIAFWYEHKREFIEDCWHLEDGEKLVIALNLTIRIERAKALVPRQKVELKYRGITYYR